MPYKQADYRWLSGHIYFHGHIHDTACDQVLLDVVEPFVRHCREQAWIARYFFVRYRTDGWHVRLRLYGEPEVLERRVKPALRRHVDSTLPALLETLPQDAEPLAKHELLRWVPYEPEVNRYGGPEGVKLAEILFGHSSETALALLGQIGGKSRSARLGKGLLAMVVLFYAFLKDRQQVAVLAQQCGVSYLKTRVPDEVQQGLWLEAFGGAYTHQADTLISYVHAVWNRLEACQPLSDTLDAYYSPLCDVRRRFEVLFNEQRLVKGGIVPVRWEQAVGMIMPSYAHMMNNRLGISIPEESYLAYLIMRALNRSFEPVSL